MTETNKTIYKCEFCDSTFSRTYNLRRHVIRTHDAQNVTPDAQNVTPVAQNVTPDAQNVTPIAQNVTFFKEHNNIQENQCTHCNKILANKWSLKRHNIKCIGIKDPYICNFCNKSFNTRNGKCKHIKICKLKNSALIIRPTNINSAAQGNLIPNVINNVNNITNNNTNNINNGIVNYNIIVYDEKKTNFVKDHITLKEFKYILNTNTDETVFSKYNRQLMQREENNCIRKLDKRSNYSQIHLGDNKWENIPDIKVYPEIISQLAVDMQDEVNDKYDNLKSKEKLFDLLDYFIYKQITDDDKETERRYKRIYSLVLLEQKLAAISAGQNEKEAN